MKNALLAMPLLAAGVLAAAGCAASSTSSAASSATVSSSATSAASAASSAAASSAASTSGATDAASGTPACTSADLKVSLGGGSGAGMSQNHIGLQLTNIGSSSCTLYGYPGVSWVAGSDGHQVGAAAARQTDPSGTEKTVTLAPGALASAPLDIVDAAVYTTSECKPVPVRGLRIYPPGEQAALFLPMATGSGQYGECSATKDSTLSIGYVEAGVQPGGGDAG